jgi:hypothetical protein
VLALRIAAVTCTALFIALLIWLYGVKTTLIWAAAMAAFLLLLWAATTPLRARQRRVWREMGLGPDGRPPAEIEDDELDDPGRKAPVVDAEAGPADPGGPAMKA